MKRLSYALLAALTFSAAGASAQTQPQDTTLNRTVVVEQEYAPDITDASKINVLPQVEQPAPTRKAVKYDFALAPASRVPTPVMPVYAGRETQPSIFPGYVRAGYGNRGNLDVRAAYRFDLGQRDKLGVSFDMEGMNGSLDLGAADWDAHYYRTRANVDYRHLFDKVSLGVAGNFGLNNFNLLPGASVGKQKLTSGDVHLGVASRDKDLPLQFDVETNLMFYGRQRNVAFDGVYPDVRETMLRTKGEVSGMLTDRRSIGLKFYMDNAFYNSSRTDDYTLIKLTPYYRYHNTRWNVQVGIPVGILTKEYKEDERETENDAWLNFASTWWVGIDAQAQFKFSDSYLVYVGASSGNMQMNDFRQLEEVNPYANMYYGDFTHTYEVIHGRAGVKGSPVNNLWFNVFAGYQALDDDIYVNADLGKSSDLFFNYHDSENAYVGAELTYSYRDTYNFSASGMWHSWTSDSYGDELLYLKPSVELHLQADVRPVKALSVNAGYHFISREKAGILPKAASVSNLYIGGSYEPFEHLDIYVRLDNLLNRHYQYYFGIPAQGFHFVGGVAFRF